MLYLNGTVLDGQFRFRKLDLEVQDGKIVRMSEKLEFPDNELAVDCTDYTLVPGFVDIHIHGGMGTDTCDADAEGLAELAKFLLTKGVTWGSRRSRRRARRSEAAWETKRARGSSA